MLGDIVMDVGGRSLQEIAERPNMSAADEKEVRKRDLQDLLLEEQQIMDTWTKETKEWQASLIEHKDSASA